MPTFCKTAILALVLTTIVACGRVDSKSEPGLDGFSSERELAAFAKKMARRSQVERLNSVDVLEEAAADVSADAGESEQVTNTQEVGVDEGGIVKQAGDYLVVLRRGRVFTIRTGDDDLEPVDAIDAFPPGKRDAGETWYDELLVRGDQIIVIGYSYGDFGTEVNRFRMAADGTLRFEDSYQLRSGDYYSSSNYASRLIGDELIFYAPIWFEWEDWKARLPALRKRGRTGEGRRLVTPQNFFVAEPYRGGRYPLKVLHTVTRCDISQPEIECEATAIAGTWSHAFYVSRQAIYVWTGSTRDSPLDEEEVGTPGQLYRVPLDGGRPGAIAANGSPVDQFSFAEDRAAGLLRVVLRGQGAGEGMWAGEYSGGEVNLLTVPFARFGNGSNLVGSDEIRELPAVEGWQFHNRFINDWLLYAAGDYAEESENPSFHAVPLDGRAAYRIDLPHGITRFDRLGDDGVIIGPDDTGSLGFSALALGQEATVEDTYLLPAAGEGETRSQAFVYRPDSGSDGGISGTLGLPVTRDLNRSGPEFLGSGSAIFFLRRDHRRFAPAGQLLAETDRATHDNCVASCVDWYGNARPIFLGDRVFALMGYEMVEGRLESGRIEEVRRIDYSRSIRPRG